ncbi:MAG: GIY-YIG nuclease family protein [Minisyncoccia bacterium]
MNKLITKLPDKPGVYIFRGPKREVFYVGKATSLKSRVASYFRKDLIATRGPILVGMVESAKSVDFIETDSALEALISEAHLIKKHQPVYNTKEKDNKSFNYVVITKEDFPRVITMRGRNLETRHPSEMRGRNLETRHPSEIKYYFGPFPQGSVLREALNIVRKIFPFRDRCKPEPSKPCFNAQIGLCPGVCAGTVSKAEYAKTIRRIKLFFEGHKKTLISGLKRDMKLSAKNLKFEEAGHIKKMIFALNHIQDVALLKAELTRSDLVRDFRIEAYDVAHISGTNVVGVMVVIEDGEPKKSDYRKFKIKNSANNDNASLLEMLERRFNHPEWSMPKLIVVDGGKAQVNTAERALKEWGIQIPVVGVVKDEHHKPKMLLGDKTAIKEHDRQILLANNEAHRFAVSFHRQLRRKSI